MLKATEQNDKLKRAIILSIALHCVLIAVLIWSSIHQPQESSAGGGGSSIDAVMVDPGAVVQQYNRQQQQQTDAQWAEQQRLKALEKQRLAAQEAAEAQQREQAEQQKQVEEAAKQAQAEAKKAAAADAKAKAAAAKKAAAQAAKQSSDVDALLGGLTDAKNEPKAGGAPAGTGKAKQSGASGAEIDAYKAQVSRAISNKFYDASSYSGRTCDLRIKLAPDGLLISVTAVGGDPALCQAAVSAAKLATIPRPPSPQVYEVFKNATLGFSPQ
ncbi:MAG: cell envelope integrity protein TolA [Sodalis sp. (in: enterobacteria)]|uniref:cell envelope integrity protein TolA n=1 Tax=Sodalis sp. (in: enterobacteria) TaxID=1898979 RepID=UPI0039E6E140